MSAQLINVALMLMLTIGFFIGLMFVVKYLKNFTPRISNTIEILGGASISNKAKVVMVQSQGTKILLGVTDNQISKLHVFSQEDFESTLKSVEEEGQCQES